MKMKTKEVVLLAALAASVAQADCSRAGASDPSALGAFRPPAVPIAVVDPHFSVWSAADRLTDVHTTFWAGECQPIRITLEADGATYLLCGRSNGDVRVLPQKSVTVGATRTTYRFGKDALDVTLVFTTPRLTDDLDVFSRPVTYVTAVVRGARRYAVKMSVPDNLVAVGKAEMTKESYEVAGLAAERVGRKEQRLFSQKGDSKHADWGWVHLVGPCVRGDETHFILAVDNVKAMRFFGAELPSWWARSGKTFVAMLAEAERDYPALMAKCAAFDAKFHADMAKVGGEKYARLTDLVWRQSFGACTFAANVDGEPFLCSNENSSGGMIGTTDVFYPQFPHLLLTSLTLAKASLAPTMIYSSSTNWPFAYAPHDLGLFPLAEGQHYGMHASWWGPAADKARMPVEECGNMLICLGAVAKAEGNAAFASRWWPTVTKWAEYLAQFGYDPGEQLCTDDFAGHLAHNANLSIKAIIGLASYALMADLRGDRAVAEKYRALAGEMVPKWLAAAAGGRAGGYRLAFDRPDSWSLKYNLVWDRLLGFNLFPREVAKKELAAYRQLAEPYGVPLDSRKFYTKSDWIIWCGALTGERADLDALVDGVYRFADETPDRIPLSDWYCADSGVYRGFIARSVVGGFFMPVLFCDELVKTYRR